MKPPNLLPASVPAGFQKLASAPTLPKLQERIAGFYGHPRNELRETSPWQWSIHEPDGTRLRTVVIQTRKGYYLCVPSAT